MDKHFEADVLNAWLEAGGSDVGNLDQTTVARITGDVVPRAGQRNWHVSIFSLLKSSTSYHNICMVHFFSISVHQGEVKRSLIKCATAWYCCHQTGAGIGILIIILIRCRSLILNL